MKKMENKKFGLIGRNLSHSYSADIHSLIGDYEYNLYPVEPGGIQKFIKENPLSGFNVTIPYKKDIIPFCNALSAEAQKTGSVNTVVCKEGGLYGCNTDYFGFYTLISEDIASIRGEKTLVLGSGGAAQTVCAVLSDNGIPFTVISRTGENNYSNLDLHRNAGVIINTTPVGMYPDNGASPLDLARFPNCKLVVDLIYNPFSTALLLQAKSLGIKAKNGLLMLAAQAVRAAELFLNTKFSETLCRDIAKTVELKHRSIVLVGMPGCGKTALAKRLANLSGRRFVDTDEEIFAKTGQTPKDIILSKGEAAFRKIESEVLSNVTKQSGVIIASGGGAVTVSENYNLMHQNGVVVFLDTNKGNYNTENRPLSQGDINALYKARLPLYRKFADYTYTGTDFAKIAAGIKENLL